MENYNHRQKQHFLASFLPSRSLFAGPGTSAAVPASLIITLATFVIYTYGTIFMAAATIAYGCLVLGLIHRKKRETHPIWMLSGMVIDIAIVLTLEIQRSAIDTALSFKLSPLQQAHIGCSSTALVLYFPLIAIGWILWKKGFSARLRQVHISLGVVAFVFRTLGFILMLSFIGKGQ